MNAEERYGEWMEHLEAEDPLRRELETISGNDAEITERFYQDIVIETFRFVPAPQIPRSPAVPNTIS